MGIRVKAGIERNPYTGEERDTEIPKIGQVCRDLEKEEGTTLVSDVVEQLEFICDQYPLPAHVVESSRKIINRLEKHDKGMNGHLFMLNRRMTVLAKRLKEAEEGGDMAERPDIPWVRQELSFLRWAERRV